MKKESQQSRNRWRTWYRDAVQGIRPCLPRLHLKTRRTPNLWSTRRRFNVWNQSFTDGDPGKNAVFHSFLSTRPWGCPIWLHEKGLHSPWCHTHSYKDWSYFLNLPVAEARDFHCCSHVFENLGKETIPSDHAAVRLVIQKPTNRGHQSKRIPSWMSKHPVFCSLWQQLHDDHRFSTDPFCAPAEFKVLLHKAKKMTRRELSRQTPGCIGAKLLITSTALRACRNRHLGTLMRRCETWKLIGDCFDASSFECIDFQRPIQIIAILTRENLEAREAEVTNLPSTQTEKDIALARCRSGQRAWRNKKPVLSLSAVTDEEGHLLENEDESGRRLCEDWWTIFQAREEGPRHHQHENIFRCVQQAPDDISWTLDQAEFDDLLALKKDSAPGPDGIPYGACRCAGRLGSKFHFDVYKAVLEGSGIPDCFADSATVLVPKTSDIDDHGRIIRSPDALRPLTLCNCDYKLLTSAICRGLHWYTMRCIHTSQRYISSKQMTDNIFEIETIALAHVACAPQESGVLLTDFAAAYPSVNHSWIFSVVENIGLPAFLCHFLWSVFKGQHHTRGICGSRTRTIPDGQRCTTRLSCERLSFYNGLWSDLPTASRDNYPKEPRQPGFLAACTMRLCWRSRCCFIILSRIDVCAGTSFPFHRLHCNLIVNAAGFSMATKSMILWGPGSRRIAKSFAKCRFFRHTEYVGTRIGPHGHLHRWAAPRKKFIQRVMKINASTKSLVERFCDFKVYAISVLSFIGSVCAPDNATSKPQEFSREPMNARWKREQIPVVSGPGCDCTRAIGDRLDTLDWSRCSWPSLNALNCLDKNQLADVPS